MTAVNDQPDYREQTRRNEEAVLAAERAGSARVDAVPMKMTFEFTGDCNIHCFFCDCEFGRNEFRKQGMNKFAMDEQTFRLLAENAFPHATVVNPTVVGEPFTFPYFDLMVDYAEKYEVKLELVTNGMLMREERIRRLLPLLDRLIMSFDGGTKETFEHCRTGAKFDTVIRNLERFRDLRREMGLERQVKFHFAVTLMKENVEELPQILDRARELDVDEVDVSHLIVFTKELRGSSLFEHRELSNRKLEEGAAYAASLGIPFSAPAPFDLASEQAPFTPDADNSGVRFDGAPRPAREKEILAHESPPPEWAGERYWCKFAWREVFINIQGDVAPCCHQNRPVVGNAFTQPWDEIWNGEEYQKLRKGLYEKSPQPYCASCPLLAEQGHVSYDDGAYMFEDRYPADD